MRFVEPVAALSWCECCRGVGSDAGQAPNPRQGSLFTERCARCHESGVPRAANRQALAGLRRTTSASRLQKAA